MQSWHTHKGLLAWQCQQVCQLPLPINTWHRTLQCQEKSGGNNKGTAGSMGVPAGRGPAARMGSAPAAGTAEVDEPSAACAEAAARVSREPAVQDKGPAKFITVEDSFKDCSSLPAARHVINVLAPDLLARMVEDYQMCPWSCCLQPADCVKK